MDSNTGYPQELPLIGWQSIAEYIGYKSGKTAIKRRKEMAAAGVIYYLSIRGNKDRARHRRVAAWPSMIQRWAALKTMKGEMI